jgi:hypothetical protein
MASWLREQGFRLDAPPFLSGAIEARKLLEQLPVKKEPLASLTAEGTMVASIMARCFVGIMSLTGNMECRF